MPPRRKNARRPLAAISEEEAPEELDSTQVSKPVDAVDAKLAQIVAELDMQVEDRMHAILQEAQDAAVAIQHEFSILLMKLPKQVREMPLVQFRDKYSSSIKAVLTEDIDTRIAASKAAARAPATVLRTARRGGREPQTAMRTTRKRGAEAAAPPPRFDEALEADARNVRGRAATSVQETPAAGGTGRGVPFTPAVPYMAARGPRSGEACFSEQGSPLGVFQQEPGTQRGLLRTVLRGGGALVTPAVGGAAAPAGAVATVVRRDKPGSKTGVADVILVQLAGGGQAAVDLEGGLDALPPVQRAEVQAQLLALRRLADTALGGTGRRK
ncbi:hypothetical protein WJX81_004874 [Elliptochloris bilobata]|uniref:Borealin N-terminal domain-containing protein n=1 Tax=Elliptochloris bilobata TaxID=381761 RepID=A0AAW1SBL2_9CHLO